MAERRRGVIRNEALPWRLRDHALFIADAPVDAPRFAAAVVIEHGIGGSAVAAPIARDCLTWLYDPARALKTLEALENEWVGDILDRMQAQAGQREAELADSKSAATGKRRCERRASVSARYPTNKQTNNNMLQLVNNSIET